MVLGRRLLERRGSMQEEYTMILCKGNRQREKHRGKCGKEMKGECPGGVCRANMHRNSLKFRDFIEKRKGRYERKKITEPF